MVRILKTDKSSSSTDAKQKRDNILICNYVNSCATTPSATAHTHKIWKFMTDPTNIKHQFSKSRDQNKNKNKTLCALTISNFVIATLAICVVCIDVIDRHCSEQTQCISNRNLFIAIFNVAISLFLPPPLPLFLHCPNQLIFDCIYYIC